MKRIIYTIFAIIIGLNGISVAYTDEQNALFITFKSKSGSEYQNWSKKVDVLQKNRCKLFRKGAIAANQGSMQWGEADRFEILICSSPVLSKLVDNGNYKELSKVVENLRVIEGSIDVANSKKTPSADSEYIIKLSHFSKTSLAERLSDFKTINQESRKDPNAWINDAVIKPTNAVGIEKPDEVTFIYYKKPGQGLEFRENNPGVMAKIGAFNRKYVANYTYLFGQAQN